MQEVVATTNVQKARMTVGDLAAEHALRAQSKIQQLQVNSNAVSSDLVKFNAASCVCMRSHPLPCCCSTVSLCKDPNIAFKVAQGTSKQLRRGVVHLRERLDRNRRFYADLAQLQRDWNIQVRWHRVGAIAFNP